MKDSRTAQIVERLLENQKAHFEGRPKPLGEGLPPELKRIVYWMATPRTVPIDQEMIDKARLTDPDFADHLQRLFEAFPDAIQDEETR